MDEKYDIVFLGTGLKECVLAGLLGKDGKKILHMDRNSYYGGDTTSFTPLENLFKYFGKETDDLEKFGSGRKWNVDKIPKFLMADGQLVKILVHTKVTRYIDFRVIDGSYVYRDGNIYKVPSNDTESLKTGLLGFFEKMRFKDFLRFIAEYDEAKVETHHGLVPTDTMLTAFKLFKLSDSTIEITGHALALNLNDEYLNEPAIVTIKRIQLYFNSLCRHGKSPFLYPIYGLGELPQGFARLSAVYGGTYMLNKPVDKILYDESGKVCGVESEGESVKCDMIICDPSYAPEQCVNKGSVVRAICLLNHPVRNTDNSNSCQIIIPRGQVHRQNDIYIAITSAAHGATSEPWFLAIASTIVETEDANSELQPALSVLAPIEQIFYEKSSIVEPVHDGSVSKLFITKSYDASSHFETTCNDIVGLYKRITGHDVDLSDVANSEQEERYDQGGGSGDV